MAKSNRCIDVAFERMKEMYISQMLRSDSHPQKIVEGLYLGSVGSAYNESTLDSLGVTHILTLCDCLPPKFPHKFLYKVVEIADEPTARLSIHFKECINFIQTALNSGGIILVHCFAGISRSATITIAYVMKHLDMNLQEALSHVKKCRPWINPNYGFIAQLRRYNDFLQRQRLHI